MNKCFKCGSVDYDEDFNSRDLICLNCGTIYEGNETQNKVAVLNYAMGENFVGGKQEYSGNISRFRLIRRTKQLIYSWCSKLKLSEDLNESSLDYFKKLLDKRKTIGVRKNMIIGVCIYFAAMSKGEPIILLDISNKLNVSVYKLVKLSKKLKTVLGLQFKAQDPLIFINRFVDYLQFEQKKKEIIQAAMKIVKMLEIDLKEITCSPTAIAVTAVVIAAKLNHIEKSHDQICIKFGICKQTVNKLINKWKKTATAQLPLEEFMRLAGPSPPDISEQVEYQIPPTQMKREIQCEDIDLSGSDSEELEQNYLTSNYKQLSVVSNEKNNQI